MSSNYEISVELPSRGLVYDPPIDPIITLRHITTREEKKMLASTSDNALEVLIKDCIVEPKDLDVKKLIAADRHFLMMKLRIHTYGSEYNVEGRCPLCNAKHDFKIDLDEFPVNMLDEDFKQPIAITLPMSGDKLELRLLQGSDVEAVNRQAKKMAKMMKVDKSELEYVLRMAMHIVSINGKEVDNGTAQGYVENMHARDSAYFWFCLDEIKIGYDTTIEVMCPDCRRDIEFEMPITREFFRPSFR